MRRLAALALALAVCCAPLAARAQPARPFAERAKVHAFIRHMATQHGFRPQRLRALFARARFVPAVLAAMGPKRGARPSWGAYRARFVNASHIDAGVEFWNANRDALRRAAHHYGVPPGLIVAIVGIESDYGRHTGRWRVIDVLSTLAFDYPPRAAFFRGQLEDYLLLARANGFDALSLRGSYAGAIGLPQFMPGSYREYAVDFNRDGSIDLLDSPADAIGSIANFLRAHGWKRGAPVALAASVTGTAYRTYANGSVAPQFSLARLARAGVAFDAVGAAPDARAALIELASAHAPSRFLVGLHNFYVITRYNRSAFYAAAVDELARALQTAHEERITAARP